MLTFSGMLAVWGIIYSTEGEGRGYTYRREDF